MTYTNRVVLALGLGVMLQGSVALAQGPRGPWYDDGYGRRGGNYGGGYGDRYGDSGRYGYNGGSPVGRALSDLTMVARRAYNSVDRHERNHFDRAQSELRKFEDRARQGRFDRGALDKAIDNMDDLARAHQLHPQDRNIIGRNVAMLRDLRNRGGFGGGYGDGYGRPGGGGGYYRR